jgi:AcrR family transcriptional regulator
LKRSAETEAKFLTAGLELFARKGYHGTTINEIALKVGLTKGALYGHFRQKEDLLFRIIEEYKTCFLGELKQAVNAQEGNALDKLHRAISFNAKFGAENPDLPAFLATLTAELKADVDFEPCLKSVYREYQKFISELIEQGIRQRLFKKEIAPDLAALIFIATHDGILHQWMLNRYHIDGQQYIRTFRKIFLSGLVQNKL